MTMSRADIIINEFNAIARDPAKAAQALKNTGKTEARVLWISTPPSF